MKRSLITLVALIFTLSSYAQVVYIQYRKVPADKEAEFVEKETKYWSKVAKAAIDAGKMSSWSLWRKVGVTNEDAPNYVFTNGFENIEAMYAGNIWGDEEFLRNTLGTDPASVETNSFTTVPFDYVMQLEDATGGAYKYAIVNYAMPVSVDGFIKENKTLWKPLHEQNIKAGSMGMTSWGMMSVIYPQGEMARFSVMTWDGFNEMTDVMHYLRYQPAGETDANWQQVMDKTKMAELMPDGFVWRIVYERVMTVTADQEED